MFNVYQTYEKIGAIQNINKSTNSFISNQELKKKYNIQIKPRKYEDDLSADYDSILPIFCINYDNKNWSSSQMNNYNLNNASTKS